MTRNGQLILNLINHSQEHLTTEQIYLRLKQTAPKVVLSTVYNNLNALAAQGLIRKVSVPGCPDRYDRTARHDHLLCKGCGKLSDATLEDLTHSLAAQLGGPILSYDLQISYLCPACKKRMTGETGEA